MHLRADLPEGHLPKAHDLGENDAIDTTYGPGRSLAGIGRLEPNWSAI